MVVLREAAQVFLAPDLTVNPANSVAWFDEVIVKPLVISMAMVMKEIQRDRGSARQQENAIYF
jgi:hypothetical protein